MMMMMMMAMVVVVTPTTPTMVLILSHTNGYVPPVGTNLAPLLVLTLSWDYRHHRPDRRTTWDRSSGAARTKYLRTGWRTAGPVYSVRCWRSAFLGVDICPRFAVVTSAAGSGSSSSAPFSLRHRIFSQVFRLLAARRRKLFRARQGRIASDCNFVRPLNRQTGVCLQSFRQE